jgi:hypothetical protein
MNRPQFLASIPAELFDLTDAELTTRVGDAERRIDELEQRGKEAREEHTAVTRQLSGANLCRDYSKVDDLGAQRIALQTQFEIVLPRQIEDARVILDELLSVYAWREAERLRPEIAPREKEEREARAALEMAEELLRLASARHTGARGRVDRLVARAQEHAAKVAQAAKKREKRAAR